MSPTPLLSQLLPQGWPTVAMVSARVVGVMVVAPVWSMAAIPRLVRAAFAVLITLTMVPLVQRVELPDQPGSMPMLVGGEFLLGVTIGMSAALFLYGISIASEVVSVQMGLSIAGALSPMAADSPPGIGEFNSFMAMGIYLALGGHLFLISGLAGSFQSIAPGTAVDWVAGIGTFLTVTKAVFVTAVKAAAPIMVSLLLLNMALAILNRAVPQLNTMMVAFPITISAGILVLLSSVPFLAQLIAEWVAGLLQTVNAVVEAFAR